MFQGSVLLGIPGEEGGCLLQEWFELAPVDVPIPDAECSGRE